MSYGTKKKVSNAALSLGVILLLASSANATGFVDRLHSLAEQAWQDEYIPDSGLPTTPLTDFDDFEVTELFRAVSIEDLEASITSGYPMPWLEETLKDESIPWEDRYWLDCRVRASIAQNTHTFFSPTGSSVQIAADAIFPGELYWQEHMIVDPEGYNVPIKADEEELGLPNEGRPVLPRAKNFDIGHLYNLFGRKEGDLAVALKGISLSRDASIGLISTGNQGIDDFEGWDVQYYANLLYSDGSYNAIQFDALGVYSGSISQDGNVMVFFHKTRINENPSSVIVMDRSGSILRTIPSEFHFSSMDRPPISSNGQYAACNTNMPRWHSALADCINEEISIDTEHTGTDLTSINCSFSPDGDYFCIGGSCKGRVIDLNDGSEYVYLETTPQENTHDRIRVSCSNSRAVTTTTTLRIIQGTVISNILNVYVGDILVDEIQLESSITAGEFPELSPNGHFAIINQLPYGNDESSDPMPAILMNIQGR